MERPVLDPDLAKRYLALIVQGSLNGDAGSLDPTVFPHPLDHIARTIIAVYATHGEVPAWETLRGIVGERAASLKPAQADLLRTQFAELAALSISDPNTTAERAQVQAHNCGVRQRLMRMINAIEWAENRGERVDFSAEAAALLESTTPAPANERPAPDPDPAPRMNLAAVVPGTGYLADWLATTRKETDAADEILLACGLAAAAGALGKRYFTPWGRRRIYPHLWVMLYGPSSITRKSTGIDLVREGADTAKGEWIAPAQGSPEGLFEWMAEVGGTGLQTAYELAGWLGQAGQSYMAGYKQTLTQLFDSPPDWRHRRTRKRAAKKDGADEDGKVADEVTINRPALSILAATTPRWFRDSLSESDAEGGFLPRWLMVPVFARRRPKRCEPPARDDAAWARIGEHLAALRGKGADIEMRLAGPARLLYREWVRKNPEGRGELLDAFTARSEAYALKFALLYAALRQAPMIEVPDMRRAITLCGYFQQAAEFVVTGELAFSKGQQAKQKVLRLVEAAGTMRRSDLLQRAGMLKKQFDEVVETLKDEGRIVERSTPKKPGRGRPGTCYAIVAPTAPRGDPAEDDGGQA